MAKSVDIFFPLYIGDYLKKTQMLSCEEHGAYMLLIFALYQNDGELKLNTKRLSRVCKLSQSEFEEVWEEISSYFTIKGGVVTNRRVSEEIGKAKERKKVASKNGKKGGRPKLESNQDNNPEETQNKPNGLANDKAKPNPEESSSPSPSPSPKSLTTSSKSIKDNTPILDDYLKIWNESKFTDNYTPLSSNVKKRLNGYLVRCEKSFNSFGEKFTDMVNEPLDDFVTQGSWFTFEWIVKSDSNCEKWLSGKYKVKVAPVTKPKEEVLW